MAPNFYSQGLNFSPFLERGVDPRTGQYSCSLSIFKCPSEARNTAPLNLSIYYSPLNNHDIGLGIGWGFTVSQYQHRGFDNHRLSLSTGDQYRVRDVGDSVVVRDRKLENFIFKKRTVRREDNGRDETVYEVVYKSGLVEILSNEGDSFNTSVPVRIYATNGRYLTLVWTAFGEQPRLTKIQDGEQDLLEISYTPAGAEIVRNPGTSESSTFSLLRTNNFLTEIRLPLEEGETKQSVWQFAYEASNDEVFGLSTVTNPAGLVERLQYNQYGHRLPNGAPLETIPYVTRHTVFPGQGQPAIETSYEFSDHNFLGYGGWVDWRDGEDNLYLVPDEYQYTSKVSVIGGSTTTHVYNKFHLVVESQKQTGTKRVTQAIEYYALRYTPFDEQPAQYQLPRTVTITFGDTSSNTSRTQVTLHEFDGWANPIKEVTPDGITTERIYYPATGETDSTTGEICCPADPHGFQRYVKEVITVPAASPFKTPTRSSEYQYRELPAAAGGYATHSVVISKVKFLEDSQGHSSTEYQFVNEPSSRDHHRLKQEITRLGDQFPLTRTVAYEYPGADRLTQTTSTTSFDGLAVQEQSTQSLLTGVMIAREDPRGIQSTFEYNRIGRLVKETVAPGTDHQAVRQYEHAVVTRADGRADGICLTQTDAKGVRERHITDGLERLCRVESQDDDGEWVQEDGVVAYSGTFRVTQEYTYNSLNQCVEVDAIDWLKDASSSESRSEQRNKTLFEYDDWGQECRIVSKSGLVTYTEVDPIALTQTDGIEGEGKAVTEVDLSGSPIRKTMLYKDGSLYSEAKWAYDGLGRTIRRTNPLDHVSEFRYDWLDRINRTIPPGNHSTVHTQYADHSTATIPTSMNIEGLDAIAKQVFDGLSRIREVTVGGRTTSQSYQDSDPFPAVIKTPRGITHELGYKRALNDALTSVSGIDYNCSYDYDPQTADTTQRKNEYMTRDLKYSPAGLVTAESFQRKLGEDTNSVANEGYVHSMSGRVQVYTDVHGQTHVMDYDGFGRPQKLTQGRVSVTFAYDKANRLSETCVKDEDDSNLCLTSRLSFDDFGREIERDVSRIDGQLLYKTTQTYNTVGLVEERNKTDSQGTLLRGESYEYDDLNRLVDYQCRGSEEWLPTEEHGHVLKRQQFVFDEYNNITEVTSEFQDGTTNITTYTYNYPQDPTQVIRVTNTHNDYPARLDIGYDANGCLTNDGQGHLMEYDSMNRLRTVKDSADQTTILSQYEYDADGTLVCQMIPGKPDVHFSYQDEHLIAITAGDSQVSYLSDGSSYWGEITSVKVEGNAAAIPSHRIWSSDSHGSVLAYMDSTQSSLVHHQQYTPYGHVSGSGSNSNSFASIGFNGEWRDPVTGWYHLGNGYRIYNPVLKRFHSPDILSPFASGEINAYAYCLGDPINRIDPSGHFSIFGFAIGFRDLVLAGVGLIVGIAAAVLSGGAALAIAAGVVSDVVTGAVYDLATKHSPTWESIGTDALYGAIGGVVGEVAARGAGAALRAGARKIGRGIDALLEGGAKLRVAGGHDRRFLPLEKLEKALRSYETVMEEARNRGRPRKVRFINEDHRMLKGMVDAIKGREEWHWVVGRNATIEIDKHSPRTHLYWRKYTDFQNVVRGQRFHPSEAANIIGDMHFERLNGPRAEYTVRLSQKHRVAFTIDQDTRTVHVFQIGGHYPRM
ncbi:hypothetical protein F4777DRAFT_571667 [Nemania sp. FL0916]|nr:hypothetical protein F4777DRAFT_571667 [Nemania sp. FL0916]